jgi:LysR family carnitine catabolism transcriptional activator
MPQLNFSSALLNAFITLAHCRQFTLAAQRCHLSQSAFSQAIVRLEAQVGARLFDRNTRSVSLTPEGELFLPVAQRIIEEFEAAAADLRDHADRRKGKVAIAALPSFSAEWLPRIIADFQQRYPGIRLQLFDVVLERTLSLVREGVVDFAINADFGDDDEFDVRPLFSDGYFLVCPPGHPLARRRSIRLRDLAGEPYIHSTRTGSMWRQLFPHLQAIALHDTGFEVSYLSTLAGMVASGLGVSVVTGVSLFNFTRMGLAAVPISDPGLHYLIRIVKRRGRSLSVAARSLQDMLERNVFSSGPHARKAVASGELGHRA